MTAARPRTRGSEHLWVTLAVVAAVVARAFVFVWWEQASFDSDQAVTGLMAKHLSEGRAFPLFFYGQNYLLAVQAWMAAPVFLALGPTVLALKLPLLALNIGTALLLVRVLERDTGLRPALAALAASFFVIAPPGTSGQLMSALGVSVEPFLYVLLIWVLRDRPIWQGVVLGLGFLHREFTAYGFAALLIVEACDRRLFTRRRVASAGLALAAAAGMLAVVWLIRPYSSGAGPGTTPADVAGAANNLSGILDRVCGEPGLVARGLLTLVGSYLGLPLGLTPVDVSDFMVNTRMRQGAPWLWPIFGVGCLAGLWRLSWLVRRRDAAVQSGALAFPGYLFMVGVIAALAYDVGRCGDLHVLTVRYVLLAILAPVGLSAAWLRVEPARSVRRGLVIAVSAWALLSTVGHVRLVDEYVRRRPPAYRRELADYLVAHHVHLARGDYWTGYHVSFLAQERVVFATDGVWRVLQYQHRVDAQPRSTYLVSRHPCPSEGAEAVANVYWVCDPPE